MKRLLFLSGRIKVHYFILSLVMLLFLFVGATQAEAVEATADSHGFYYTVQPGDTLYSIANRYGSTVYAISVANNIVNPSLIYAGSTLWIPTAIPAHPIEPPPTPEQPLPPDPICRYYHIVTWGDTMLSLGRLYGVSPWAIGQANRIYNLNIIYRGQTMCIP